MILGVPPGLRKVAFRAFLRELQAAPILANSRVVKTWRTWDGTPGQAAPPTVDQMPVVGLKLVTGPVRRLASTRLPGRAATWSLESTPTVVFEIWTKGTDQGDSLDLADLIHRVLAPADDDARKAIQTRLGAVGIRDWQLTGEILPPGPEGFSDAAVYAAGSYRLTLIFNS